MRPEDLAGLPNYSGIYFDPMTGKTYLEDGSDTGYTFERARWSGPVRHRLFLALAESHFVCHGRDGPEGTHVGACYRAGDVGGYAG